MMDAFKGIKMDGKDPTFNKINSFWKMLDDMSQNDKQGYDKFISKHLKEGVEEIKKEQDVKREQRKVESEPGMLLKFRISEVISEKQAKAMKDAEISQKSQIKFHASSETHKQWGIYYKSINQHNLPILEDKSLYLNICVSDKILGILSSDGKILKNYQNINDWGKIPLSFSEQTKSKSLSVRNATYQDAEKGMQFLLNVILDRFYQKCVKYKFKIGVDKNQYKFGFKVVKNKLFRGCKGKGVKWPDPHVINEGLSVEDYNKFLERQKKIKEKQKKDVVIKTKDEEEGEVMKKLQGFNAIGLDKKKVGEDVKEEKKKMSMIEVVKERPKYVISAQKDTAMIQFELPEEQSMKSVELDVSEKLIKLQSPNYQVTLQKDQIVSLMFNSSIKSKKLAVIDIESTKAKFKKKNHTLTITINIKE